MWKPKLNHLLNIIMGSAVGVFIGYGVYAVWDYETHTGLYTMQSAPWYTDVFVCGGFTAAVLFLGAILKLIIWKLK